MENLVKTSQNGTAKEEAKTQKKAPTKAETEKRLEAAAAQLEEAEQALEVLSAEKEEAQAQAEKAKKNAEELYNKLRNLQEHKKPLSAAERLARFNELQTMIGHHDRAKSKKQELEQFTEMLDSFGGFIHLGVTDSEANAEQVNFRITDSDTVKAVINLLHETIGNYIAEKLKQIEAYQI